MIKLALLGLASLVSINTYASVCGNLFHMGIAKTNISKSKNSESKSPKEKQSSRNNKPDLKLFKNTPILDWTYENGKFPDLTKIKAQDLLLALEEVIQESRDLTTQIKNEKNPTFENVIEALEFSDVKAKKFDGIFGWLYSGFKDAEFQKVEGEILKKLNDLSTEFSMDQALFAKVEAVYNQKESLSIDQKRLVEKYRKSFIDNGLNLKGEEKARYIKNNEELVELGNKFSNNVMESKSAYKLVIKTEAELSGLPPELLAQLKTKAEKAGETGYLLTLEPGIYAEVMAKAENREIRKALYIANGSVAYNSGKTDNTPIVRRIAELRQEQSELLGFKNYSEYSLRDKMAENIQGVNGLADQLATLYKPQALKEEKELRDFVASKGEKEFEAWDRTFWIEKLLKEKYVFNEDAIKQYLEYGKVQSALFQLADKLYGIKFTEKTDLPMPLPDVQVFEVRNSKGELLSYFILDPLARMGTKSSGAWASRIFPSYKQNGERVAPIVTNSTNFSKPETGPFLLKVDDAVTMFHEFGHALHSILTQARYPSQSATAVARDFVELPSQFMENFFFEKDVLKLFAYHHKTNELIPDDLVQSVVKFKQFRSASATLRQLGLIKIDMAWHTGEALKMTGQLHEIEQSLLAPISTFKDNSNRVTSTSFGHIFDGGYSSAYYSYKWAEVLDADAFSIFRREGIFNPKTAERFQKAILETGGSRDAMKIYIEFAGRKPTIDALLERDGIKKEKKK